uniref:RNA-directed DNA polymerase n=1 Tax=Trichuris muris TaxID=70415 RepID=A0A5S6QK20_TRIMR
MAYLDDVIVFSTFAEHITRLESVLKAILESGLRHLVDAQGIRTDPSHVAAMAGYPAPRNVKELRRFLGLCGYYRRFVHRFAVIARPLTTLLRKQVEWRWGEEEKEAFSRLKKCPMESPVLRHFDDKLPTEIYTDASQQGLRAVLIQRGPLEERYHSNELECLAVVWALHRFRHYVHCRKFTVVTDNAAVMWLFSSKKSSGKLAC